jgi:hypothetical protein
LFVQQINFATDDPDEMLALAAEWADEAIGRGTVVRTGIGADAAKPGHYAWIVYFASAEAAQQNSDRAETAAFSARLSAICTEGPTFRNLDIVGSWPQ